MQTDAWPRPPASNLIWAVPFRLHLPFASLFPDGPASSLFSLHGRSALFYWAGRLPKDRYITRLPFLNSIYVSGALQSHRCRLCQLSFTLHFIQDIHLFVMISPRAFLTASAALTLIAGVTAGPVVQRNEEPPQPACTSPFQPFVYAGCFSDPSSPRGLLYDSGLPTQNMTVEICVAFCKGTVSGPNTRVLSDMCR